MSEERENEEMAEQDTMPRNDLVACVEAYTTWSGDVEPVVIVSEPLDLAGPGACVKVFEAIKRECEKAIEDMRKRVN